MGNQSIMSLPRSKRDNAAGIFYFPAVAFNLIPFWRKNASLYIRTTGNPRRVRFRSRQPKSGIEAGVFSFQPERTLTVISIYLSGSLFKKEGDWRLGIISPFNTPPLSKHPEMDWLILWGKLEESILGYLDYVGPFPGTENLTPRTRYAIKGADLVFVWADQLTEYEVGRVSAEIGSASALRILVGIGSTSTDNPSYKAIWGAEDLGAAGPTPFIADTPVKAFRDFIKAYLSFASIAKLVELYLNRPLSRPLLKDEYQRCGYVYVIKADTGEYKIGRSKSVPDRMKLFAVKLPFAFEIIHFFPCLDMYDCESFMHHIFKSQRKRGEWFTLTAEDVEIIKQVQCFYSGYFADQHDQNIFRTHPKFEDAWLSY